MTLVLTLLLHAIQAAGILVFPALALWSWRSGESSALWRATRLGLGLVLLLAAILASAPAGNALAPTYGYGDATPRALILYGLALGLPLITVGLAVHACARRHRLGLGLHAVGVISAVLAWVVGVIIASRILSAIA
jgi:hypothetical protein